MNLKRIKVSFQVSILTLIMSLLLLYGGLVTAVSFLGAARAVQTLAKQLIEQNKDAITANALDYLNSAENILEVYEGMETSGVFDVDDMSEEERRNYFIEALEDNPQFSNFFFGEEDGTFFMAKRMPDDSLSFLSLFRREGRAHIKWAHQRERWNSQFPSQVIPEEEAYHHHNRSWYREAKKGNVVVWSDIYIFASDNEPGITCSMPTFDADQNVTGVIGIDINVISLSKHMDNNRILNAESIIVTDKGDIVAKTDLLDEPAFSIETEDGFRPLNIEDLSDHTLSRALMRHQINQQSHNGDITSSIEEFKFQGSRYLAIISSLPEHLPWNWNIAVVVDKKTFLHEARMIALNAIIITTLLMIGAIIVAVIFSYSISNPLRNLSHSMGRIRSFDLEHPPQLDTRIKEIYDMVENYNQMVSGLRSFRKYVPADLVKRLILMGQEAFIGGNARQITIFFSDIASFTSLSETMPPKELVNNLSHYLNGLSKIISNHQGTIDKYIGDAIMAFWGAPEELENHAIKACQAALACQDLIHQHDIEEKQEIAMPTRFGLHTGEAIVGNIGSEERMNYTVIGDNVNLASRLEGLNKYYGTKIIISEATYSSVKDHMEVRSLDFVIVKGKLQPIRIYELLGVKGALSDEAEERRVLFNRGFELYLERQFREAEEIFAKICQKEASDKPSLLYLERCQAMQKNPPPPDWNGAFQMETK